MAAPSTCPSENCPTLGVDAVSLDEFAAVETNDGELLVYDTGNEDAWIQSDAYDSRDSVV